MIDFNHIKETILIKITSTGTYLSVITGILAEDHSIQLSNISYLIGIFLGLISICIKLPEFIKLFKK